METKPETTNVSESIQTTIPTPSKFEILILAQAEPISEWSIGRVGDWIEELSKEKEIGNFDALKKSFIANKINGKKLLDLVREDIKDLGITLVGDIKEVEEAISNLRQGNFDKFNSFYRNRKQEKERT
jgi:bacillopeptidase F (M6 metalloprotease family)